MPDTDDVCWDHRGLLTLLGGPTGARQKLYKHGLPLPNYPAVLMWHKRQQIPGEWLARLLWVLMAERPDLDLKDLLVKGDSPV